MTGASTLYLQACDVFDTRVRGVSPNEWAAPTPCTEWNVRELVNHVTVEHLWAPPLLAGRTMAEVGDAYDGDQLGDDPVAAWTDAVTAAKAAAAEPDVDSRTVHLSYGDDSAAEYLRQVFADTLVHAWDLAAATGGDTSLPPDLVYACAAWFAGQRPILERLGAIGADGVIGDEVPTAPDADPQTKLLAAFGRRASATNAR